MGCFQGLYDGPIPQLWMGLYVIHEVLFECSLARIGFEVPYHFLDYFEKGFFVYLTRRIKYDLLGPTSSTAFRTHLPVFMYGQLVVRIWVRGYRKGTTVYDFLREKTP